jgi:hypothetical protein
MRRASGSSWLDCFRIVSVSTLVSFLGFQQSPCDQYDYVLLAFTLLAFHLDAATSTAGLGSIVHGTGLQRYCLPCHTLLVLQASALCPLRPSVFFYLGRPWSVATTPRV